MASTSALIQRRASSKERAFIALMVAGVMSCASTYARADERANQYTFADQLTTGYADADELPSPYAYADELGGSSRSSRIADDQYTPATLEKAFWGCCYAATTRGVMGWEGLSCGEVYEDVKRIRFGGDFQAMLTWWQKNKGANHQALAEAAGAAAP